MAGVGIFASQNIAMVVPVIGEAEWMGVLRMLPAWLPPDAPMVVVVPHPDDETLATGGLISVLRKCGTDITVVAVTDGENAYAESDGVAELRAREQTEALARLGVSAEKIVRLGLVDSDVAEQEDELVARLMPLVRAETVVLAPWSGDFHPDHEACARAATRVAQEVGATLISYFFWTWHRGTPELLQGLELRAFALDDAAMAAKREALACHRSQLQHVSGEPILPEELLWPARMPFEVFAL